jgi:sarcosine oxidase subunit beta
MDVVVVGGGIVGLSSATYLASAGVDVTLCEREALGTGSTARSAGGIRSQYSSRVNVELSEASRDVWESFEERFGVDIAYRQSGYLLLAREESTADRFRADVAMQNDLGVDSEYLPPDAARDRCPGLLAEPFVGATYNGADGFADPNLAVQGYAGRARELGVDVRTETPVEGVRLEDERVTGVETPAGRIDAEFVVNATGAWAGRLASMADVSLPIEPRRRQVAVVEPTTHVGRTVPLTIDLDTGSYFRPEREGSALVGGHFGGSGADPAMDPDEYSEAMDLDWAATAVEHAADYTTYFDGDSRIKRGWAGLYAVTPDHHPIVEETRPGLITAAGFSGHGFQHAPATGQVVAELCVDGEASTVDVDALDSDRFGGSGSTVERNVA